jgi:hypothetical protein
MQNERVPDRATWSHPAPVRAATHETALAEAPLVERGRSQVPARLDAALLDRLTDDVIRRVDQRLRIERQRRGL